MNKKEFFNKDVHNEGGRKMNIIEQHQAFYNPKLEDEEMQLAVKTVKESIFQDTKKWVNKFIYEMHYPSKDIQAINNALEIDTTGKSRNEIISAVIKEIADRNYKEIKKIENQNSSSGLHVVRTNIDECRINDEVTTIFEGDIATAIQELNTYIEKGTKVLGVNMVFLNIEDKIPPEEQEQCLIEIEKRLKYTRYNWIKIERVPEINKWIVIDCVDNKIIFQASPEKLNKIMVSIIIDEEELADKNWSKIQELNNKLDVPVNITRIDKLTCSFMKEDEIASIYDIAEVMQMIYQKEVWRKEAEQRDFEKIQKMLENNPEYPINMVKIDSNYCELREKGTNREIISALSFIVRTELERMIKEKAETNITVEEQIERLVKITEEFNTKNKE